MARMKIMSVRNEQGIKVKKCCASCQHKCIKTDGVRFCAAKMVQVETNYRCKEWQMSEGLMNAGLSGGVVRKLEFTKVVLH